MKPSKLEIAHEVWRQLLSFKYKNWRVDPKTIKVEFPIESNEQQRED